MIKKFQLSNMMILQWSSKNGWDYEYDIDITNAIGTYIIYKLRFP